jgi:hypothetical protein
MTVRFLVLLLHLFLLPTRILHNLPQSLIPDLQMKDMQETFLDLSHERVTNHFMISPIPNIINGFTK